MECRRGEGGGSRDIYTHMNCAKDSPSKRQHPVAPPLWLLLLLFLLLLLSLFALLLLLLLYVCVGFFLFFPRWHCRLHIVLLPGRLCVRVPGACHVCRLNDLRHFCQLLLPHTFAILFLLTGRMTVCASLSLCVCVISIKQNQHSHTHWHT